MIPLAEAIQAAAAAIRTCAVLRQSGYARPLLSCANDARRDPHIICVVEEVADLWALERSGAFHGRYHVLAGCCRPSPESGRRI